MAARTAFCDESIRRYRTADPVYLLAAYIAAHDDHDLIDALSRLRPQGKLHWYDAKPTDKDKICRIIAAHPSEHLLVAVTPLIDSVREERARQRALATMLVLLEQEYDVSHVVLERRERNQDEIDRASFNALRSSGALAPTLTLSHQFGNSEPRLWVPDQVVGAFGDSWTGSPQAWSIISERVRVVQIAAT